MKQGTKVAGALLATTVGLTSVTALSIPAEAVGGPPARIKGVVTTPAGAPLAGIHVATLKWNDDLDLWSTADSDTTGVDGGYSVGKLETGTYRVRYYDPSGTYATEFYNDKSRAAEAEPIDVSKGHVLLEPAQLGGAAHMTGRVTGTGGTALPGASITAYVKQEGVWIEFQSVVAGADGSYDLGGLPGGEYTLGFHDPVSGVTEYWNDRAALVDASAIQLPSSGSSTGLDAELATPVAEEPTPTPTPTTEPTPATPTTSTGTTTTGTTTGTTTSTATGTSTTTASASKVLVVKMPKVKGFAKVDQRLRVTKGAWNPTSVKRKIQWLANGKKIKGATKMRLRLTRKMAGKKISVKVTAKAAGMTPVTVRTKSTKKVKR
jgi:hypothetical protein